MMCLVQASRVRVFGLSRRLTRKNATKDVNPLPDRDGTAEERSEIALRDRTHRSPGWAIRSATLRGIPSCAWHHKRYAVWSAHIWYL